MSHSQQIWLLRHGDTEWSLSGQHTGSNDLPLVESGVRQAEALGRYLNGRPFAKVLVSPLERARETCRIAGYLDEAEVNAGLKEWNYGDCSGRTTFRSL